MRQCPSPIDVSGASSSLPNLDQSILSTHDLSSASSDSSRRTLISSIDRVKSKAKKIAYNGKYNPFYRTKARDLSRSPSTRDVDLEKNAPDRTFESGVVNGQGPTNAGMMKPSDSPASTTDVESQFGAAAEYYRGEDASVAGTLRGGVDSISNPTGPRQRIPGSSTDATNASSDDKDPLTAAEDRKRRQDDIMKQKIPAWQQVKIVLFPRWLTINWLLIFAPVGIALHFTSVNPLVIFIVNFLAIIPLAGILSYATEELAMRIGEVLGGLLNASFGNAVELIVGIIALAKKEIIIVQTSLIGSMLSNLLLVMGMCFFFGGVNRLEQYFNMTVAQTAASILALAVGGILIPTAFTWSDGVNVADSNLDEQLSRGTAIIMLFVYGCYLLFQLKSHKDIYNAPSQKVPKRKGAKKEEGDTNKAFATMGGIMGATSGGHAQQSNDHYQEPEEELEEPNLSMVGAIVTLLAATAIIGVCAEFLVDSINAVTCEYGVSQYFVGLILLPIVGNAAEHATALTVAIKDKMDLAIGVAVGSSMQIALLVLPLMVILGWIIGADMTLVFDDFQIVVLFVAIVLVNYLIADGKSHWLEGVLLMALYIIIAVAAWFYPKSEAGTC